MSGKGGKKSSRGVLNGLVGAAKKEYLAAEKKFLEEHGEELKQEAIKYRQEIQDFYAKHHRVPSCKCECHNHRDDPPDELSMECDQFPGFACCIECPFCERDRIPVELLAQHLLCCRDTPEQVIVSMVDGQKKEGKK